MFSKTIPDDFLRDESRLTGSAEAIAFPRNTEELRCAVITANGRPITIQGARTGIAGGAVPSGGVIISLARMNRILSPITYDAVQGHTVTVQPGVTLSELRTFLKKQNSDKANHTPPELICPTDPTETSASLGGMAACNASGARSFAYGATANYINGITAVLPDGDILKLKRNQCCARDRSFSLTTEQGRQIKGVLPDCATPSVKSAAGYRINQQMDLLDLFIGSEGTLAIITEIELKLVPAPCATTGVICFFSNEEQALNFTVQLRDHAKSMQMQAAEQAILTAIEYFDEGAFSLIRHSSTLTGLQLPQVQRHWKNAIYIEWNHFDQVNEDCLRVTAEILKSCESSATDTWLATDNPGLERMKAFRHAVPEQVNAIISQRKISYPQLTKLGTDLSVPDQHLFNVMRLYRNDLITSGLEHVIFGHIGDNHLHVNIIPRNMQEHQHGKKLYQKWAQQIVNWGGSVSAEHGIGQLKKDLLLIMYGEAAIDDMRNLKALFDPSGLFNKGRLFD